MNLGVDQLKMKGFAFLVLLTIQRQRVRCRPINESDWASNKMLVYQHKDINKQQSFYEKKRNCFLKKISFVYCFLDYKYGISERVGISLGVHYKITNVQNRILRFLILF